ncbi:hypothetical protein [Endozoicomonas lisbonensis]|uniref:DUF2007 domain-containing protein n=1 Tax=Endozoicomonas lisbonensis TaxID=3120522 RepID=A0ABV2SE11_9GAMM
MTIARYPFPYDARLAKGLLDGHGIPAFVFDEHLITMNWLYSNAGLIPVSCNLQR